MAVSFGIICLHEGMHLSFGATCCMHSMGARAHACIQNRCCKYVLVCELMCVSACPSILKCRWFSYRISWLFLCFVAPLFDRNSISAYHDTLCISELTEHSASVQTVNMRQGEMESIFIRKHDRLSSSLAY